MKPVGDICIPDSGTTHTILKKKTYFSEINPTKAIINTISGPADLIEGSGNAMFTLPNGTKFVINDALYSPKSKRNLLSFNDIYRQGYDTETITEGNIKYICITANILGKKKILEKLPKLPSGLHYTYILEIECNLAMKEDPQTVSLWHDRLGHPGSTMMKKVIESTHGHPLKSLKINNRVCEACSLGKLITRHAPCKLHTESPAFLERIQGDICGPIHPPSGPFRYFMVLIDASSRWSHVCLLSSRDMAFARFLAQIIKLRAQFPDYTIKKVRLDNAGEFTSESFNNYCMSIGITVEHPVPHVHTQNGLAESLIKRLQYIARPLMMRTKLPITIWGHAILHAASLIRLRPSANHKHTPYQLAIGQEPSISHLKIFGCAVYVPIATPQRTKMGPQRRLGIYVGYESPSIIRYLEPLTGDVFQARFADCHFDETIFPPLGGEKKQSEKDITWYVPSLLYQDPYNKSWEENVKKIVHLQGLANQLPDSFTDMKRVTKSHVPAINTPARIEIPKQNDIASTSKARLKRGRPMGSKDKNPRKRKGAEKNNMNESDPDQTLNDNDKPECAPEEAQDEIEKRAPEEAQDDEDEIIVKEIENKNDFEMSINYVNTGNLWNRRNKHTDEIFAFSIACEIMNENDDPEPRSVLNVKVDLIGQNGKMQ